MLRPLSGIASLFLGFEGVPVDCPLVGLLCPSPWEGDPPGKDVTHLWRSPCTLEASDHDDRISDKKVTNISVRNFLKSRVLVHRPLDSVPHSVPGLGTEIKHNVTSVFVTGGSSPSRKPLSADSHWAPSEKAPHPAN